MKTDNAIKILEHNLNLGVEGNIYLAEREALKLAIKALKDNLKGFFYYVIRRVVV